MPFYVNFVQLPQRFQMVNFTTAERAGVLLLSLTVVTPIGALVAGFAIKKVAAEYIFIFAAAMLCIGIGLLGSLPTHSHLWIGIYGYEIIVGVGMGLAAPPSYLLLQTSIAEKDVSVGTGAPNMMRTLGGCVAVAICTAVHRQYTSKRLTTFLSPEQIKAVQTSSVALGIIPDTTKTKVARIFGESYNRQFLTMLAFTSLNLLVTVLLAIVRKKKGVFGEMRERKEGNEFFKAADKTDDGEEVPSTKSENDVIAAEGARSANNSDEILAAKPADPEKIKV